MKKKELKEAIKELDCILKDLNEGVKTIQIAKRSTLIDSLNRENF